MEIFNKNGVLKKVVCVKIHNNQYVYFYNYTGTFSMHIIKRFAFKLINL